MQKWRRPPDTKVRRSRSFMQKLSPNQPVYIDMAQERSGKLNINTSIFFNSSTRTSWTKQTYGEKSWGHRPFWELKKKNPLFPIAIYTKTWMLFGQHFDGEVPRNLNHVFLKPFWTWFQQKIGTFLFNNHNERASLKQPSQPCFPRLMGSLSITEHQDVRRIVRDYKIKKIKIKNILVCSFLPHFQPM